MPNTFQQRTHGASLLECQTSKARFGPLTPARIALETGSHSPWASELLAEFGHEVIVAHVLDVRAITGSDRKSDQVDARKLARYASVDPEILHPVRLRDSDQQRDLVLIQARAQPVRRERSTTGYHQSRQHEPALAAGGMCASAVADGCP